MDYSVKNNNIILHEPDLSLSETLDCGQAFRWEKISENEFFGYAGNKPLKISQNNDIFTLYNVTEEQFLNFWAGYFDLETDYGELKKRFSEDKTMCEAIKYAPGIRLLRQDAWETLFSFIISQNNNISRIKGILKRLCDKYGGFPSAENLKGTAPEDYDFLRAGFRSKYLSDCAEKVNSGETDLDRIKNLPTEEAERELMKIKGVGPKVAACVTLFGMYKTDSFPKDVWIKRVMAKFYPNGLPECVLENKGIAQQYLFHYIRTSKIEI